MILKKTVISGVALALALTSFSGADAAPKPTLVSSVSEWGFLAREASGNHAVITSLLTDPNADPHEHEASLGDAASVQNAQIVIQNGAGYDTWLKKLLTNQSSSTAVINVASLMKVRTGSNPHLFFDLSAAQALVVKLETLNKRKGFQSLGINFASGGLKTAIALHDLQQTTSSIAKTCAGVKVAATEDIAGYLLSDMKLHVITPKGLRLAIGNGVDPSVSDLATALGQMSQHPAFLVYNSQTVTPLTAQILAAARSHNVPIIRVPEVETKGPYTTFVKGIIDQMKRALVKQGCMK